MEKDIKDKYRANFLGSVFIFKVTNENKLILENRAFRIYISPLRILKSEFKENKTLLQQYNFLLGASLKGLDELNKVSFLEWKRLY